jgi:hypothetical protein
MSTNDITHLERVEQNQQNQPNQPNQQNQQNCLSRSNKEFNRDSRYVDFTR